MSFSIKLPDAALTPPTGGGTVTLFNSIDAFGIGGMKHQPIKRLSFTAKHDQGFTIVASMSADSGTNWDVIDSQAVSVLANTVAGPFDYLIDTYDDFKLEVTNGGVDQTVWRPTLKGIEETRQPGT